MASDDAALVLALDARAPLAWRQPGFVRPLAGLLLYVSTLLLLLGPYLYLTALVIPAHVQPFPAVDGAFATVEELLLLGWAFGDVGLTSATVRAVATLRRSAPDRLLPQLRLLVRWQLVSCVLLAFACAVSARFVPTSQPLLRHALAFRAITAPLLALSVLPAIFEALQRYDRQLLLELVDKRMLAVLLPIPCVLIGRRYWDPTTGALGGLIAGQGLATLLTGVLGLVLLTRIGLPLRALRRGPLPTPAERHALHRFGLGIMAGKAVFFVAGSVELAIVLARLPDYAMKLGIKQILLGRLLYPLWLLWPFCESLVPTLVDLFATGQLALARTTVARYLQHGHLFVATLFALVLGGAPPLLRALLPPAWHEAATLLPLAGITGLLLPLTWIADGVQRAHGDSGRNAIYLFAEQILRLSLLYVLVPRVGLAALFVAAAIAASVKTGAVLIDVHRHRLALRLPIRTVFVAPALGALVVGLFTRAVMKVAIPLHAGPVAFVFAAIVAFPLSLFVVGCAGGLDDDALSEFDAAFTMAPLRGPLHLAARVFISAGRLGASFHRN